MGYRVDNAIIMAAGTSSRFAPLSYERPKALIEVKGEILIERQIRQLREAGVDEIVIVVGYGKEKFAYLREKFGVILIENDEYLTRNNHASLYVAREYLRNSYICSSDNYFSENPFESEVDDAYYAAVYAEGETKEWCMTENECGYIDSVTVGGRDAWYMLGHVFFTEAFSREFLRILAPVYDDARTRDLLWESIFAAHLDTLKMKMRKYEAGVIFEFDTLDELRLFDTSYVSDTRSRILKELATRIGCTEAEMTGVTAYKTQDNAAAGMTFTAKGRTYRYAYDTKNLEVLS